MTKKLSNLLSEYFMHDRSVPKTFYGPVDEDPVRPISGMWEIHSDPERFSKRFKFDTRARMISFVNEVFDHEDKVRHHSEIRIDYTEVDISVYTHDVNRITELDKEFTKEVDKIYRDVLDFEY